MSTADRLAEIAEELYVLAARIDKSSPSSFVVGDFVRVVEHGNGYGWQPSVAELAGKVVSFCDNLIGVEFAENIGEDGHDLEGASIEGHGRWFDPDELERVA